MYIDHVANIHLITNINSRLIIINPHNNYPFNPLFFMLLTANSFEIFPKHNEYIFFRVFCFELLYLCVINR